MRPQRSQQVICQALANLVIGALHGLQRALIAKPAEAVERPCQHTILATRFILFNQVAMIRRSAFENSGGFKPGMRLLEDYDLAFRLALLGPWAFITEPLVEKHNDTNGIGVLAMRDPLTHSRAQHEAITGFLRETGDRQPQLRRLVERALRDVAAEIRIVEWSHGALLDRMLAKAGLFLRRKHHALRRRMPGWRSVRWWWAISFKSAGSVHCC